LLARTLIFIGMLGATPILLAQASSTASRAGDLQIGGGYTTLSPDIKPNRFTGGAAYVDFNFTDHLGAEGEFHFATDSSAGNTGEYEKTYEVGARYFRTYRRFLPYAKVMYGRGVFNFTEPFCTQAPGSTLTLPCPANATVTYEPVANLAYNLAAGGVGVDYEVLRHVNVRAEWEYQRWFNFEGSSLSPSLITIGGAYHF
jgi:opacity protein-like surface antigen